MKCIPMISTILFRRNPLFHVISFYQEDNHHQHQHHVVSTDPHPQNPSHHHVVHSVSPRKLAKRKNRRRGRCIKDSSTPLLIGIILGIIFLLSHHQIIQHASCQHHYPPPPVPHASYADLPPYGPPPVHHSLPPPHHIPMSHSPPVPYHQQSPSSSSLPPVVRHPGTCTYQRSQAACTFSLLCYLAGGLPIEGCGGDLGVTCCMLYSSSSSSPSLPPPPSSLSSSSTGLSAPSSYGPPPDHVSGYPYPSSHHSSSPSAPYPSLPGPPGLSSQNYHQPSSAGSSYYPHHHTGVNSYSPHHQQQQQMQHYQSPNDPFPPPGVHSSSSNPYSHHATSSGAVHSYESPQTSQVHQSPPPPPPIVQEPPPQSSLSSHALSIPLQTPSVSLRQPPYHPEPPSNYLSSSTSGGGSSSLPNSNNYEPLSDNTVRRTIPAFSGNSIDYPERTQYARNFGGEDVCGKPTAKPRSRIIGGQSAYFGEFPWQVHIKIAKHQCGGALVNRDFVVTAAHCVYQAPLHQLSIIIGAYDIEDHRFQEDPPQYFSVAEVRLHPNFRFSASHPDRFDVAVLKLDKSAHFADNVLPVCLPPKGIQFEGWYGVVTGWGKTDPALSNRYGTRLLQKVDVPIIKNDECENWHQTRGIDLQIFPEMFCAGYEDGRKDACVGDSGGPLVVFLNNRWTLAGITSAGFGCAQSRQPGIYHRLPVTVDWVLANISN